MDCVSGGVVMFEQKNGLFFVVFVCFSVGVLIAVGAYKQTAIHFFSLLLCLLDLRDQASYDIWPKKKCVRLAVTIGTFAVVVAIMA